MTPSEVFRLLFSTKRRRASRKLGKKLLFALKVENRVRVAEQGSHMLFSEEPLFLSRQCVEYALEGYDLDMLQTLDQFPLEHFPEVEQAGIGLRIALDIDNIANVITPDHISVYREVRDAFLNACKETGKHLQMGKPGYTRFELHHLVFLHMDRSDELVKIIEDRNITDKDTLRELMNTISEQHSAVSGGAL